MNTGDTVERLQTRYNHELKIVFESKTQSYREVLLGCALAHMMDPSINIRLPYVKQGSQAFNGRTLDEQVINPFLMSKQIPCSRGPYLATFRRNVKLDVSTREGLRDKDGYDAMLLILSAIELASGELVSKAFLIVLLKHFIILRDNSKIRLIKITRMSVEQYSSFISMLLHQQSGGLLPLLLTIALFRTINEQNKCGWDVIHQGINSADGATGAAGDISIMKNDILYKAIEVTERPINRTRVVTTFDTKISINNAKDYLFVYTSTTPDESVYEVSRTYFAQGFDINFIRLQNLLISVLLVGNDETRVIFTNQMIDLLDRNDVPSSIKTAWNDSLQRVIES
jgi:hypothetical protein